MDGRPGRDSVNRISVNLPWAIKNQDGEGVGAVVHEMVHVVQQYRFGSREVPHWLQVCDKNEPRRDVIAAWFVDGREAYFIFPRWLRRSSS